VKLRKELWFGFSLMAAIVIPVIALMPWANLTNGHLGLMMLALICVGIMFGFPTAFTLMGMGVFNRGAHRDLFLKQETHGIDARVRMEAINHAFFAQVIREREQDHPLMMRHIGTDDRVILARPKAFSSKVH